MGFLVVGQLSMGSIMVVSYEDRGRVSAFPPPCRGTVPRGYGEVFSRFIKIVKEREL